MDKVCVFCGDKPEVKTVEHVIPKWLIELTGNPKRKARFGYQKERTFSFNSFKFPSCASCNQKYSELETTTKLIIEKMLDRDYLSAKDFDTLLDWLDKVRIGLWLGFQYLDKNSAGIAPKYYIEKRIGASDRMLAIIKGDNEIKGLNFTGCGLPSFTYTPSCFSLRINNLFLLNMSYNDLFSRRIGFPYPRESFVMPEQQQLNTMTWGRNRVMVPLLKRRFTIKGTEIYQPMFRDRTSDPSVREVYDTRYVHDNSMVWDEGRGKIFIQDNGELCEYPATPSKYYVPKDSYKTEELLFDIQIYTLEWQQYIDSLAPSLIKLPIEDRREYSKQRTWVRKLNRELIQGLLNKRLSNQTE